MQIQQINPMIIVVLHILQEFREDLWSNFKAWLIEEILNVLLNDELVAFNIEILEERIDCQEFFTQNEKHLRDNFFVFLIRYCANNWIKGKKEFAKG